MKLSSQAQWYLNGNFPAYDTKSMEPTAMQELIDKDIVVECKDFMDRKYYKLTELGEKVKKGKDA